ncbi:MAG TPA: RNA chaperone Hfq [Nitrospirota bacterium]|nr:RNA chaperone Hfq [Nitrospirota bacterium]
METNLFDRMLSTYMADRTTVTLTLQNKIRVSGRVKAFDSYVVVIGDQKCEILYRHAISSLAPSGQEAQKPEHVASRQTPAQSISRPQKNAPRKPHPAHRQAAQSPSADEPGINNGMKEGLLKWIREQNAAK